MADETKIHWAKTPEGRKRLSESLKAYYSKNPKKGARKKARKLAKKAVASKPRQPQSLLNEAVFSYALGYTEAWLNIYAQSAGISSTALAARVGSVLQSKNSG